MKRKGTLKVGKWNIAVEIDWPEASPEKKKKNKKKKYQLSAARAAQIKKFPLESRRALERYWLRADRRSEQQARERQKDEADYTRKNAKYFAAEKVRLAAEKVRLAAEYKERAKKAKRFEGNNRLRGGWLDNNYFLGKRGSYPPFRRFAQEDYRQLYKRDPTPAEQAGYEAFVEHRRFTGHLFTLLYNLDILILE